eukprot:gnl/MRDRNA2_/MRDRNA2_250949_c0_seq1.p1 gnl/MRDRNA2_/MRDRNA2_250949_c0~~gnl/MRDRNA2_/MRDRNA2_250949_c0_seq1.p1  ORF type:complete len:184 (-),score=27.33 gnl/MRDRNA2_/MRDRNA2_250949_c0_seq1:93-644(-)
MCWVVGFPVSYIQSRTRETEFLGFSLGRRGLLGVFDGLNAGYGLAFVSLLIAYFLSDWPKLSEQAQKRAEKTQKRKSLDVGANFTVPTVPPVRTSLASAGASLDIPAARLRTSLEEVIRQSESRRQSLETITRYSVEVPTKLEEQRYSVEVPTKFEKQTPPKSLDAVFQSFAMFVNSFMKKQE